MRKCTAEPSTDRGDGVAYELLEVVQDDEQATAPIFLPGPCRVHVAIQRQRMLIDWARLG